MVTRRENRAPLRQNGVIVHLTRDLSLLAKKGRPLSQGRDLGELWAQRAPLYREFADITVENSGTIQETAGKIEKELKAL